MRINDIGAVSNGHCSDKLPRIVAINEDIRSIMGISSEINLAAINAMLIAKKIGFSSSGFSVVSSELRTFSRRLGDAMRELQEEIAALVHEAAGQIVLNKEMGLQRSAQSCAGHYRHWEGMYERKSAEFDRSCATMRLCRDKSARAIGKASKLCVMGVSLSYSAKVEAVYGNEQSRALKQVSEDVESAIGCILATLKKLEQQLVEEA